MSLMVEWHDSLPSTQDRAHQLAERGAPHGSAVAAHRQTAARGTRGRGWDSGAGGLWLSVVLRPEVREGPERLGLRVGLALAERLERAAGIGADQIRIKWPNDLVARDRKLGGVLCEARWQSDRPSWIVVGVGVNVRNQLPPALRQTAIRLADLGSDCEAPELAPVVVDAVVAAGRQGGRLDPDELAAFARRDWLIGRRLLRPEPGRVAGLAPSGRLLLATSRGEVRELLEPITWADVAPAGGPGYNSEQSPPEPV